MPTRNKPPVKLEDVARMAGVSTATVSRALSMPSKVRPATLERVLRAARESGYVLDGAARALRSRRTRSVGVIVPTLDNAIFAHATHALQKALEAHGYTLLVACHEFDLDQEVKIARDLVERGIDGIVLVGLDHRVALFETIAAAGVPHVVMWSFDRDARHPCVGFRNREAAMRLAAYLVDLGHRRFAMIAGETRSNDRARERVEGVCAALAERGIRLERDRILERAYTFADGREAMHAVMALSPRPTAVICGNDVLAIGAISASRSAGIDVPREVSITGFDDLEIASMITPALTTVHVPSRELGHGAAEVLLRLIAGEQGPRQREVAVELVVRDTTAPPRRR